MSELAKNSQNRIKRTSRASSPHRHSNRRLSRKQGTESPTQEVAHSGTPMEMEEARNQLLRNHVGLVYHVAKQLGQVSAVNSTFDERVSAGMLGLMRAAEKFDPTSGTAFSTYAAPCIRGAILDDLRAQDHVSRSVRTKMRRLKSAHEQLCQTLGRRPLETEMAQHLTLDLPTFQQWRTDIGCASTVSLDEPISEQGESTAVLGDLLAQERDDADPTSALQREQEVGLLRDALLQLPEQQRTVLALYYYEELTLSQIATVLNVTESRVSQIRTRAIHGLRKTLAGIRG